MRSLLFMLAAVAVAGCNTLPKQPEVVSATMTPSALKPGESAVVAVTFQDKFNVIHSVTGVIPEDPSVVFKLYDRGIEPDEKANDDTWSLLVDAPFNAPPGSYVLEVTAYNSIEEPVLVQNGFREVFPLGASIPLTITADE